jgi:hypothetical protein
MIQLCFSAVAHPDEDEPYMQFKEDHLQQHSLTKYQRIKRLHAVGSLGSRRPTQLMAKMMELAQTTRRLAVSSFSCFSSASLPG